MSWFLEALQKFFFHLLHILFSPDVFLAAAQGLINLFIHWATFFLPSSVGESLDHVNDVAVGLGGLFNVGLWLLSPILDPYLARACVGFVINNYFVCMTVKFLFWFKGHFWSSSH